MPGSFFALIRGASATPGLAAKAREGLAGLADPLSARDDGHILWATAGPSPVTFPGGVVAGTLFERRRPGLVRDIDPAEAGLVVGSGGKRLIEAYWGGYVALLGSDRDAPVHVVRGPFGEFPCLWTSGPGYTAIASDPDLLVRTGLARGAVDWTEIARDLAWCDLRGGATCLAGIRALRGGERLTIRDGRPACDVLWTPWQFVDPPGDFRAETAVERVRRATLNCVAARASAFDHVLLLLSGGLDSSIVAACLAQSRSPFTLATLTTRDALGDERDYGRCMARAIDHELHEKLRDVGEIDPDASSAARLPRPAGRLFEQQTWAAARAVAGRTGAQAILTGGGGDNVYCSLQSASPAADRLLACGPGRQFLETVREISRLAPASMTEVLLAALGRLAPWRRTSPTEPDVQFMTAEARDAAGVRTPHPWVAAPRGALPGKAAHVKLLALAESFQQGADPRTGLPVITPLLDQPLVETCLSVPSWCWFERGRNRAVARRAFEADLPEAIAWRRSKGTPDSFAAEIYERYRGRLRDRVLGGLLAEQRLIDIPATIRAFDESGPLVPTEYRRLLRLADVENWARLWAGRS